MSLVGLPRRWQGHRCLDAHDCQLLGKVRLEDRQGDRRFEQRGFLPAAFLCRFLVLMYRPFDICPPFITRLFLYVIL